MGLASVMWELLHVIEDVSGVVVLRATTTIASDTDMINQFFEPPRPKNIAYEGEIHRSLKLRMQHPSQNVRIAPPSRWYFTG